jgi:transposase InsO family protein
MNGTTVSLKHDTGSDWLIISKTNWQRIGAPKLSTASAEAICASDKPVQFLGYFSAVVELKNNAAVVNCYVAPHELNLFGASILEALELWDKPVTAYCDSVTLKRPQPAEEPKWEVSNVNSTGLNSAINTIYAIPLQLTDLQQATDDCEHLKRVKSYIETRWPSNRKQIPDSEAAKYFPLRPELRIINKCVFRGDRPVIPPRLRYAVLEELHKGHPGATRMTALAREKCFWPGINDHIKSFVVRCQDCAINAKAPFKETQHPWPIPDNPWQRIHIDFVRPIGQDYFLVVVDAHSNWPEVIRMPSTTTEQTCRALSEIFARWGTCRTLVSENAAQLVSTDFKEFCARNGIEHIKTAPFQPQSNGRAEKFGDTLKRGLEKLEGGGGIDERLQILLKAYRSTPCFARGGKSPFYLMTGREMPSNLDLLQQPIPDSDLSINSDVFEDASEVFPEPEQELSEALPRITDPMTTSTRP